jgi:starch phosphorylase
LFDDIHSALTNHGDPYFHLADFRAYAQSQEQAAELFRDRRAWARTAVLNVARIGYFSSDRAITQYAEDIWQLKPVQVKTSEPRPRAKPLTRGARHNGSYVHDQK